MEAIGRARWWTGVLLLLGCWAVDPGCGISYKVEPGPGRVGQESGLTFSTSVNRDQFVFSDVAASFARPQPATVSGERKGRVRFLDTPDPPRSPANFFSVDRGQGDSFYTVGATIQMASSADTITPPPVEPTYVKPPKRRKLKVTGHQPTYDRRQQLDYEQQPYSPLQDNYLQSSGQRQQYGQAAYAYPGGQQNQPTYYPGVQQSQPAYDTNSLYPANYQANTAYYPYPQQYPPNPYLQSHPQQQQQLYQNPFYQHQPNVPATTGAPNAQSILGFLQSIFNFAPGTFGTPAAYPQSASGSGSGFGSGFGPIGGQLRQALDNISENDELQCVPKLVCMMSRSSSGLGFSNYVNRGLLSTILSAVPDSSPWLKFSRAALLGYGIGANSCDAYYPKCPKDEMQILYYLNNHRGGFFRFFNNDPGQYGRPGGIQQG